MATPPEKPEGAPAPQESGGDKIVLTPEGAEEALRMLRGKIFNPRFFPRSTEGKFMRLETQLTEIHDAIIRGEPGVTDKIVALRSELHRVAPEAELDLPQFQLPEEAPSSSGKTIRPIPPSPKPPVPSEVKPAAPSVAPTAESKKQEKKWGSEEKAAARMCDPLRLLLQKIGKETGDATAFPERYDPSTSSILYELLPETPEGEVKPFHSYPELYEYLDSLPAGRKASGFAKKVSVYAATLLAHLKEISPRHEVEFRAAIRKIQDDPLGAFPDDYEIKIRELSAPIQRAEREKLEQIRSGEITPPAVPPKPGVPTPPPSPATERPAPADAAPVPEELHGEGGKPPPNLPVLPEEPLPKGRPVGARGSEGEPVSPPAEREKKIGPVVLGRGEILGMITAALEASNVKVTIKKFEILSAGGGLRLNAEIDAGMLKGRNIRLSGIFVENGNDIAIKDLEVKAMPLTRLFIESRINALPQMIRGYLQKKYPEPIARIRIAEGALVVEFQKVEPRAIEKKVGASNGLEEKSKRELKRVHEQAAVIGGLFSDIGLIEKKHFFFTFPARGDGTWKTLLSINDEGLKLLRDSGMLSEEEIAELQGK